MGSWGTVLHNENGNFVCLGKHSKACISWIYGRWWNTNVYGLKELFQSAGHTTFFPTFPLNFCFSRHKTSSAFALTITTLNKSKQSVRCKRCAQEQKQPKFVNKIKKYERPTPLHLATTLAKLRPQQPRRQLQPTFRPNWLRPQQPPCPLQPTFRPNC